MHWMLGEYSNGQWEEGADLCWQIVNFSHLFFLNEELTCQSLAGITQRALNNRGQDTVISKYICWSGNLASPLACCAK